MRGAVSRELSTGVRKGFGLIRVLRLEQSRLSRRERPCMRLLAHKRAMNVRRFEEGAFMQDYRMDEDDGVVSREAEAAGGVTMPEPEKEEDGARVQESAGDSALDVCDVVDCGLGQEAVCLDEDALEEAGDPFDSDRFCDFAAPDVDDGAFGSLPGESDDGRHADPCSLSPKELGRRGEDAACELLKRKDYVILERNWTCPAGEADIIAMDGDCLVFVEVKTRAGVERGLPEDAVTPRKRAKYERIAGFFLSDYDGPDSRVRFDVIGVLALSGGRALARHVVNAFGAGD